MASLIIAPMLVFQIIIFKKIGDAKYLKFGFSLSICEGTQQQSVLKNKSLNVNNVTLNLIITAGF